MKGGEHRRINKAMFYSHHIKHDYKKMLWEELNVHLPGHEKHTGRVSRKNIRHSSLQRGNITVSLSKFQAKATKSGIAQSYSGRACNVRLAPHSTITTYRRRVRRKHRGCWREKGSMHHTANGQTHIPLASWRNRLSFNSLPHRTGGWHNHASWQHHSTNDCHAGS